MKQKIITEAEGNPHKFYEKTVGAKKILIQRNGGGDWHGYINCMWKEGFRGENSALEWFGQTV